MEKVGWFVSGLMKQNTQKQEFVYKFEQVPLASFEIEKKCKIVPSLATHNLLIFIENKVLVHKCLSYLHE